MTAPNIDVNDYPAVDRYGFLDDSEHHLNEKPIGPRLLCRRETKWRSMFNEWRKWDVNKRDKLRKRLAKGIPPSLRGEAWRRIIGADELQKKNAEVFRQLSAKPSGGVPDIEIIERDLDRTFPAHIMFMDSQGTGQADLYAVLRAYSLYRPEVGYCQGMAFLAGMLLMHMPAENAFWMMVALLDRHLKLYFLPGLPAVQVDAGLFADLLHTKLPRIASKLEGAGIEPLLFATDWFMCVMVKTVAWPTALRLWDLFMLDGITVVFRAALAILKLGQDILIHCCDMNEMMSFLRDIPPDIVTLRLLTVALKIKLNDAAFLVKRKEAINKWMEEHPQVNTRKTIIIDEPKETDADVETSEVFSLLREAHETIRFVIEALRVFIISGNMDGFVTEWNDLYRMMKTHFYVETNGLYPLLEKYFENICKEREMMVQHDKNNDLIVAVSSVIESENRNSPEKIAEIVEAYEAWTAFMLTHMEDKENILRSHIFKLHMQDQPMRVPMIAHKHLVMSGVSCGDWEWYIAYNIKKLEKLSEDDGKHHVHMFVNTLRTTATPEQWVTWASIVHDNISPKLLTVIDGLNKPGKIVLNDKPSNETKRLPLNGYSGGSPASQVRMHISSDMRESMRASIMDRHISMIEPPESTV